MWKLKWPIIRLQSGNLEDASVWSTIDAKFALMNNCKCRENKKINKNAFGYLCKEETKLVCFKFSALEKAS